jgi:PPOX class probable F420-dependent enzyme
VAVDLDAPDLALVCWFVGAAAVGDGHRVGGSGLMRLSAAEARARFVGARVARLATVSAAGVPHLVPVTFAVLGERIVFVVDDKPKSTARLRRLDNIAARPFVCLLVDVYDEDWTRLWWARADGTATVLATDAEAIDALAARYPAYVERRPSGPVVSIEVITWTGWAAAGTPDTAST